MKIRAKLLLGFVIPILIIGVVSLAGFIWNKMLFAEQVEVTSVKMKDVLLINNINNELSRYAKTYAIVYNPKERENFSRALPKLQKLADNYKSLGLVPEEQEYFAKVESLVAENTQLEQNIFETAEKILESTQNENDFIVNNLNTTIDKWEQLLNDLNDREANNKRILLQHLQSNLLLYALTAKFQTMLNLNQANEIMGTYLTNIKTIFERLSIASLEQQEMLLLNAVQDASNNVIASVQLNLELTGKIDTLVLQEEKNSTTIDELLDEKLYNISEKHDKAQEEIIIITNTFLIFCILAMILVCLLLSIIFAKLLLHPIDYLRESISKLRAGENIEIHKVSNDEIGELSDAFKELVNENRKHSASLNEQNWLKEHIADILHLAQSESSLENMCNIVTGKICELLSAGCGAFYITNEDDNKIKTLYLLGTYGYKERKNISSQFKFGESLVGQSALEGKIIILSDVPDEYVHITSGLGDKKPSYIILLPITLEDKTLGVMEFALFHRVTEIQQQFLEQLSNNLAVVIEAIKNRQKAEIALKDLQKSSEELQVQQEELRATNEELEEKTQVLQKSEEELKAQSEEMQASNEELEEKMQAIEIQKQEIQNQNTQLETIKQDLEQKAEDLARAGKYKTEFLANMSHELRTPLNSLLLLSNSFAKNEDGNLTSEQIEQAKIIHKGGNDLLTLINDILDLSKVEAGKLNIQIENSSIKDILTDLRTQFEPMVTSKGLQFIIESTVPFDEMQTDSYRIKQILRNLLSNALKFTSQGSISILVSASPDNKTITFKIVDTGIGIEKKKFKDIFEAFQQAYGDTDRTYGGTGLGLTISRELARLLGGEIQLESELGKGSSFALVLPANSIPTTIPSQPITSVNATSRVTATTTAPTPSVADPTKDASKAKGEKKILLVVKDPAFIKTLTDVTSKKGYECINALDISNGMALAREYRPEGIIIDLSPQENNKFISMLKSEAITKDIPVHIVSKQDVNFAQNKAADDFGNVFEMFKDQPQTTTTLPILLIEDELITQKAVVKAAKERNIMIQAVGTGAAAMKEIETNKYAGLILDINLPDTSGIELLEKISKKISPLPPVIIYSQKDLTAEEYTRIHQYTNKIVLKAGDTSMERLLNECSLFLHSVNRSNNPKPSQEKMIADTDKVLHGKEILLVDDDMRNVYALSMVLKRHGIAVTIATNGMDALQKLEAMPKIDLVIMDIMMPVLDGYETTRRIRKLPQFKELPIIAVTAKAMPDDKRACLEAGANEYITKPIDADKLLSMMRVWLSTDRNS